MILVSFWILFTVAVVNCSNRQDYDAYGELNHYLELNLPHNGNLDDNFKQAQTMLEEAKDLLNNVERDIKMGNKNPDVNLQKDFRELTSLISATERFVAMRTINNNICSDESYKILLSINQGVKFSSFKNLTQRIDIIVKKLNDRYDAQCKNPFVRKFMNNYLEIDRHFSAQIEYIFGKVYGKIFEKYQFNEPPAALLWDWFVNKNLTASKWREEFAKIAFEAIETIGKDDPILHEWRKSNNEPSTTKLELINDLFDRYLMIPCKHYIELEDLVFAPARAKGFELSGRAPLTEVDKEEEDNFLSAWARVETCIFLINRKGSRTLANEFIAL